MGTASYRSSSYRSQGSLGRRAGSFALALAIVAAILAALVWLGAPVFAPMKESAGLTTFDVNAPPRAASVARRAAPERQREQQRTPPRRDRPPPPPPTILPPLELPGVIVMSRADYAASDVGRIKSDPGPTSKVADASSVASSDSQPIGRAPDGQLLYAASWYRKPTNAEMEPFLPKRRQTSWGRVVCRMIERYRVDDCREVDESPGSGMARAVRLAAWQFLVRPPQVNGKPQIGTWVQIRYELNIQVQQ